MESVSQWRNPRKGEVLLMVCLVHAGMNTGIQDAHNLAWKIASVVKGIAPSSILHTYETERRPVLRLPVLSLFLLYFLLLGGSLTTTI